VDWSRSRNSAGNVAGFKAGSGQLKCYINVNDNAPRAAPFNNACECRIKPSEAATGLSVQTGLFPTAAQAPNGLIIRKSLNASASPWIAYADDRTLIMFIMSGDYGIGWSGFYIGEYFSLKTAADAFNGLAIGRVTEQVVATPTALPSQETLHSFAAVGVVVAGHFVARSFSELAQTAVNVGKHGAGEHSSGGHGGIDGVAQQRRRRDASGQYPRGRARDTRLREARAASWDVPPPAPVQSFNHLDTFAGKVGTALAGKTFRVIKPTPNDLGAFVVENSNTVETN
jgi:hypothetical protein